MGSIVRQATSDDAAAAAALIAPWTDAQTAERIAALIAAPGTRGCIAERDQVSVGIAARTGTGTLELLYVDPDQADAGIDVTLLEAAEDAARAAGHSRITLDSTRTAPPFYRRFGYRDVDRAAGRCGVTCYPMEKALTALGEGVTAAR